MTVAHHALVNDLPEYKDAIHALKVSDAHFAKLMDQYHDITREVEKAENAGNAISDEAGHDLKARRVKLKDELLQMLTNQKDKCCGSCGCS